MKSPMKILVVEDEMIIGAQVALFLTELGYEVTGIFPRAEEALLCIKERQPDIALMDIQLKGDMNGIELAIIFQEEYHIPVIFLTANTDDATFQKAKAAKPYGFLSKPFSKVSLQRTLELAKSLIHTNSSKDQKEDTQYEDKPQVLSDRIFIYHEDKKVKIMLENILYVEAERNYCRIVSSERDYLLTMPMKSLEGQLLSDLFQRIHRSYIINLRHLDAVDEGTVIVAGKLLLLSKSYRKEFLMRIRTI